MIFLSLFFVSFSSLCFEVLLTRFFSISQWNHLSFMVISIVLFGFAASGTALSIWEQRYPGSAARWSTRFRQDRLLLLFSLSVSGAFLILNRIPLDYFRMPLQGLQAIYLLLTFLLLTVPFFFSGLLIALAYATRPEKAGLVYACSMIGSALGALLPGLLLPLWDEGRIIVLSTLPPLLACLPRARFRSTSSPGGRWLLVVLLAILFSGFLVFYQEGAWLGIKPSPYKFLSQSLQFPDTEIESSLNTLRGRLDNLESPYIRFAPGLSLKYQGALPGKKMLVHDADHLFVFFDPADPRQSFAQYTHPYAGYLLAPRAARVLLIQQGGGLGLPCAWSSNAQRITLLVDLPPRAWRILGPELWSPAGRVPPAEGFGEPSGPEDAGREISPPLAVEAGEPRSFLAREGVRYQVIQVEQWGASIPGMASLNQDYTFTVEALEEYFEHLVPRGILIISRKLHLPPSDSLRLFGAAFTALKRQGRIKPEEHLVVLRNWGSYTLLASPAPFSGLQMEVVKDFCRRMNFDLVYYPQMREEEANRFNVFEQAFYYQGLQGLVQALRAGKERSFAADYLLDISPVTDDRPFFNRFTKWLRLGQLYRSTGSRFYSLLMSGEVVLLVVFLEAALIGWLLLLLPRLLSRRRGGGSGKGDLEGGLPGRGGSPGHSGTPEHSRPRERGGPPERGEPRRRPAAEPGRDRRGGNPFRGPLYFFLVGAGFILAEMGFIQEYSLLFGDPVIAFTVVLGGMLVFSGLGGLISAQWRIHQLGLALLLLASLLGVLFGFAGPLVQRLLGLTEPSRILWAVLLLLPVSLLLGIPFPVGLRLFLGHESARAYAWAGNGVASVLFSILAIPLAMTWGISRVFLAAGLAYGLVFLGVCLPMITSGAIMLSSWYEHK